MLGRADVSVALDRRYRKCSVMVTKYFSIPRKKNVGIRAQLYFQYVKWVCGHQDYLHLNNRSIDRNVLLLRNILLLVSGIVRSTFLTR